VRARRIGNLVNLAVHFNVTLSEVRTLFTELILLYALSDCSRRELLAVWRLGLPERVRQRQSRHGASVEHRGEFVVAAADLLDEGMPG
jgi:hypothetical protein